MTGEAIWDWVLGWAIRLAGLFWVLGSFMLFRQIRMEMALDADDVKARGDDAQLQARPR